MRHIAHCRPFRAPLFALLIGLMPICAQAQTTLGTANVSSHLQIQLERLSYSATPRTRGEPVRNAQLVLRAYRDQSFEPIWTSPSGWLPRAHEMLDYIENLHQHGLSADDYHFRALKSLAQDGTLASRVHSELLLSDAFISLTRVLHRGRSAAPDPEPFAKKTTRLILRLKQNESPANALNAGLPESAEYWALTRALKTLVENADSISSTQVPIPGPLDIRSEGQQVGALSERLRQTGDYQGPYTERYDETVRQALKRFQTRYGLDVDGIPGPATLTMLNAGPAERARQVAGNLARLRSEPEQTPATRIDVNIAAQHLEYFLDGKLALQMPVIVGRTDRPTPQLQSAIKEIVLNPDWTVPYRIAVRDKLPQIQREPGYLLENNFAVYASWSSDAPIIDPTSVNWTTLNAENFPYVLRQAPGPNNALGQVKFLFDNPYSVYLHDTPTKALFSREQRLFSSGCIRLAEPMALASALLENHGQRSAAAHIGRSTSTQSLILEEPVPVRIRYQTAWVDRRGELQLRADIYGHDAELFAELEQTGELPSLARLSSHLDDTGASNQVAQVHPVDIF